VMGSVLFRLLVAIALRWGVNPNDLKLITAVFVFAALILPGLTGKLRLPGVARGSGLRARSENRATLTASSEP
jgi:putative tryptophan/tyrosine transport system permease protein